MRTVCFLVGLLSATLACLFALCGISDLSGIGGVRLDDRDWWPLANFSSTMTIGWMVAAAAFRPRVTPDQRP